MRTFARDIMSCIPTVSTAERAHRSASSTRPFARTSSASVRCASITFARSSSERRTRTASRTSCSARSGSPPCQTATPSSCCVRPASDAAPISSKSSRALRNSSSSLVEPTPPQQDRATDSCGPRGRREAPARLGESGARSEHLLGLPKLQSREVRGGELDQGEALEIGATGFARDLQRVAAVPLDARQVALPPADRGEESQDLGAGVAGRVRQELERFAAQAPRLLDVGIAVQEDLGELDERQALEHPVPRRLRLDPNVLHLRRGCGELPHPPGGSRCVEAAFEVRLELDRAQQQPARPAVRLPLERPTTGVLERGGRLGAEARRAHAPPARRGAMRRARDGRPGSRRARPAIVRGATRRTSGAASPERSSRARRTRRRGSARAGIGRRPRPRRSTAARATRAGGRRGPAEHRRRRAPGRARRLRRARTPGPPAPRDAAPIANPAAARRSARRSTPAACPGCEPRRPRPAPRASGSSPRRTADCPPSCRGARSSGRRRAPRPR